MVVDNLPNPSGHPAGIPGDQSMGPAYILKVKKLAESIHEPKKIGGKSA